MGGVDHHDWLVGKYSVSIRGKKWYWPLFTRFLDMAVVNSWVIYRMIHQGDSSAQLSDLDFKRAICVSYMKLGCKEVTMGRPRCAFTTSTSVADVRYDGKDHIEKRQNQQRCQNKPCTAKPRTYCSKCSVTLCVQCFGTYHKRK